MKPRDVATVLDHAIPAGDTVCLVGGPGVGKSDLVTQACERTGHHLILNHPVISDPTDYKGLGAVIDGRAVWLPYGDAAELADAAEPTVCFFDDAGQAPIAVQAAMMQVLLARKIGALRVSPEVTFILATNRIEDRAGVAAFLEPLKSRAVAIVDVEPDLDDWVAWGIAHDVPAELLAFVRFRPSFLSEWKPTRELANTCNPRVLAHVGRIMRWDLPEPLLFPVLEKSAGAAFAAEFVAFLRIFHTLPDLDLCLLHPADCRLPDPASTHGPSTYYAMAAALLPRLSTANVDAAETLMERWPDEYAVFAWRLISTRRPELLETGTYTTRFVPHYGAAFK